MANGYLKSKRKKKKKKKKWRGGGGGGGAGPKSWSLIIHSIWPFISFSLAVGPVNKIMPSLVLRETRSEE